MVMENCDYEFPMKVDDDSFINMGHLINFIQRFGDQPRVVYLGQIDQTLINRSDKYSSTYNEYTSTTYDWGTFKYCSTAQERIQVLIRRQWLHIIWTSKIVALLMSQSCPKKTVWNGPMISIKMVKKWWNNRQTFDYTLRLCRLQNLSQAGFWFQSMVIDCPFQSGEPS